MEAQRHALDQRLVLAVKEERVEKKGKEEGKEQKRKEKEDVQRKNVEDENS